MADAKLISGILGVILLSGAGLIFLTPEQLDAAFTCTTNNVTGIFERFSSTNVTAYWSVDGVEKRSVCTKGVWIPTREWLKINNLTEKDIALSEVKESDVTEEGLEIIKESDVIIVDRNKQVVIEGKTYDIVHVPQIVTKCICDKIQGCKISECA